MKAVLLMVCFCSSCIHTCGIMSWQIWQRLAIMSLIVVMVLFHDAFIIICMSRFDVDLIQSMSYLLIVFLVWLSYCLVLGDSKSSEQEWDGDTFRKYPVWHHLWRVCSVCVYLSEISRPRPWKVSAHSATDTDSAWKWWRQPHYTRQLTCFRTNLKKISLIQLKRSFRSLRVIKIFFFFFFF